MGTGTPLSGDIVFENNTNHLLSIYISGWFSGLARPHGTTTMNDVWSGPCRIRIDAGAIGCQAHNLLVKANTCYRLVLDP